MGGTSAGERGGPVPGGTLARPDRRYALCLVLAHVFLSMWSMWGYALRSGRGLGSLGAQTVETVTGLPDLGKAAAGTGLLLLIGLLSAGPVRRRVPYDAWYHVHLPRATGSPTNSGWFSASYRGRLDPTGIVKGWAVERAARWIAAAAGPDGVSVTGAGTCSCWGGRGRGGRGGWGWRTRCGRAGWRPS